MRRIFDVFPFMDELDVLEVRLHELNDVVDAFIICEAGETYGGTKREYVFEANRSRFNAFRHKIVYQRLPRLHPDCTDRTSGRLRERDQRDRMLPALYHVKAQPEDVILFSDCDEIPSADAVRFAISNAIPKVVGGTGIHRFKQTSFYYNVNTVVDYGHDFASRARIGTFQHLIENCDGSLYEFRMANKNTETMAIENGGWHFGYFGDLEKIKRKVAALSPFLSEYKLFGDDVLKQDIMAGRDLHHRRCALPEKFEYRTDINGLPEYLRNNLDRFRHFTRAGQVGV